MLRCDHHLLFYRVLCAALFMTAITFTVILTNVFIDIDWFLSNKNKHNTQISEHSKLAKDYDFDGSETEGRNEDNSYESENVPFYRTRRSIDSDNRQANRAHDDSQNIQLHVKDPGLKKILTSRLASLLKELDEEETTTEVKTESTTATSVKAFERLQERDNMKDRIRNTDVFHLAMHNILLQGMLGHMDLNDVYKRVHRLVNGFNDSVKNKDINSRMLNAISNSRERKTMNSNPYNEESKLISELINCKKLESDIARNKMFNNRITAKGDATKKDNKIYINAVIEIKEDYGKLNKINLTNATDNIIGDVKLIYNGKPVNVNQNDETKHDNIDKKSQDQDVELITIFNENKRSKELATIKTTPNYTRKQNQNSLLNKLIEEYFKTRSPNIDDLDSGEMKRFKSRRLKRQLKMQYEEDQTNSPKSFEDNTEKYDDNVYIEIETHFNRKGIKGEKKQKLVKTLIDKIQKALRSDIHETDHIIKNIKFVKRTQDPIDGKHILINKIPPPHDRIEPRKLDPIDKTLSDDKNEVKAIDDSWTNQIESPKFLSTSKSVNSAEMRELNINYDNVLKNGIPKRLQKPINTDGDEDDHTITPYIDNENGNVTLLLKDIDGTGFSIGINQYVGEPPDINSIKMFNGLESLIKEYHQSYDQDVSNESDIDKAENFVQNKNNFIKKSIRNGHNVLKRSLKGIGLFYKNQSLDKHLKPFKSNYDKHLFKLQKYLNNRYTNNTNKKSMYLLLKKIKLTKIPEVGNNSLSKKSSNILKSNSLISRKKRSLTVKKISNVNSKIKLSKYINTHARTYKRILLNNSKRNKRQINKIRIIARESRNPDHSEENIFRMSGENPYSDKGTVIKEFETPDTVIDARNHYDDIYPMGDYFRIQHHTEPRYSNFYDKIGPNRLMSKYPHIFINDGIASKEVFTGNKMYGLNEAPTIIQSIPKTVEQETQKTDTQTVSSEGIPNVEEIINAIMPSASKPNYKLTVKISPKNPLNISNGFKEVHTSVNKTFDENGLRYFTLFNLSHISKIEELNKTTVIKNDKTNVKPSNDKAKEQFHIKKLLQLHKKRVDQQLSSLVRESKHLEAMIDGHSKEDINQTINTLHDDLVATDSSNDEKMNKILASIKKLQESYNVITNDIRAQASSVTDKPKKASDSPVIHTMESNDKITNEILKKIDANTDILKTFLERFSDNFKSKVDEPKAVERMTVKPTEIKLNIANDWKRSNRNVFYGLGENKNATIPLVYTYQQNKGPQARIYHLHANAIPNDLKEYNPVSKIESNVFDNLAINKQNFNGSKFFMDEIENDFKVEPNKPFIEANIKINSTTT